MTVERTFDRLVEFDPRSRSYPIRTMVPTVRRGYTWSCALNLDQGSEGACTGFATTHEAAARPRTVAGLSNGSARALYYRARQLDPWPGEDYEGSSVLAAVQAGAELGWYPQYRWAFGENDLALALGYKGPAILGINWYEGMYEADAGGYIHPTGALLGGHAILCKAYSVTRQAYLLHNSWGSGWGVNGCAWMWQGDIARLLAEQGEACIPVVRAGPTS